MDITPHDYGEPWRLVQTQNRSDLVLRDGTPFRGNNPLEEKAQPRTIACVNAFAGVSDRLLGKLAEAAADRTAELRMLLLALVADPQDKVNMAALRDYLDENLGRPESVVVAGIETRVDSKMGTRWWASKITLRAARAIAGFLNRSVWSVRDLEKIAAHELEDVYDCGPKSRAAILDFLKSVGLEPTE